MQTHGAHAAHVHTHMLWIDIVELTFPLPIAAWLLPLLLPLTPPRVGTGGLRLRPLATRGFPSGPTGAEV